MANTSGADVANKLQNRAPQKSLEEVFQDKFPAIKEALPRQFDPERFMRLGMTVFRTNAKLRECNFNSFLAALMQSVQAGLEPNTPLGEAYLIPYGKEVQFQMSYKGIVTLAHRSREYKSIYAHVVYPNDRFNYQYGLHKDMVHIPADEPEGEPIYYYAVYHLINGGYDFAVWSRKKIEDHAQQYSQAVKKGWTSPWKTDFDQMAKKTVVKDLLKMAPKSIEVARAVSMDETVKSDLDKDMSIVPAEDNIIDADDFSTDPVEKPEEEPAPQGEPEAASETKQSEAEKKEDKKGKDKNGQQGIDEFAR